MGNSGSAVSYYEESVEFLSKIPAKDLELVHTLSVSLNKIGDLRYYDGDLQSARVYYARSLEVRREAVKDNSNASSQGVTDGYSDVSMEYQHPMSVRDGCISSPEMVDLAVSLAKVADVDRTLGNEGEAISGFQEAIKCLASLKLESNETGLEKRRQSVQEFLQSQLAEQKPVSVSSA